MQVNTNKRSYAFNLSSAVLKLSPIAVGCAVLLATSAGSVYAQQADTSQQPAATQQPAADTSAGANTVVVTGIRRGIEDALESKRDSDMIVETISAEDLGRLPDDSIADALSSLPGVSAQITGGRATTLNIRGLSGDFINTTFNGREQASVGDNRAVMFDQYPAELISGATIYKTPDAALIGQGLAATVDLKTLNPLDFSKQVIQVKAMGESTSYGELNPEVNSRGDRLSASYIDQFANHTIGVAFGFAHLDSPVETQEQHSWGIGNGPTQAPGFPNANSIQGAEWWADSTQSIRNGAIGVVEWKPNKNFTSTVDSYFSQSTEIDVNRGLQTGTDYSNVTNGTASNNFLTGGNNLYLGGPGAYSSHAVVRNDLNSETDQIFSIGWKNVYKADAWTFTGDISGSTASSKQSILELYSGVFSQVTAPFTASQMGGTVLGTPSVNFANPANVQLGDPGGWGQDGYDKFPAVTDKVREYRAIANRELDNDVFSSVEFGLNITDRTKTRVAPEYFVDFAGMPYSGSNTMAIPSNMIVGPIKLPNGPTILGLNAAGLLGSVYQLNVNAGDADVFAKDWSVDEKISTAYSQLNINTTVAGIPVRGNVGMQLVHSSQSSEAIASNTNGLATLPQPMTGGASYNNWLPSLNLIADFQYEQQVRLGLAEELQRPRFDDMTASNEASLSKTTLLWSSTTGNPELKPTLADALDVSYTKYFGKKGYISIAPYYKYLRTYIYTEAENYNYAGLDTNGVTPLSNIGTAQQPENGTGGSMNGLELTVSVPFDMFTPVLEGFGIDANASHGNSKIQTNFQGVTAPSALPGFSSDVANMVLYYTNGGFEIRYRESYRSAYLGEVQGFGANLSYSNFLGVHTDSLQTSYEFKDGPLKGLTGLFQVLNLNNPAVTQTFGVGQGMSQTDQYGRTYLLGLNYKM